MKTYASDCVCLRQVRSLDTIKACEAVQEDKEMYGWIMLILKSNTACFLE